MTAFTIAPDTADLLELIADTNRPTGRDAADAFLAACKTDAAAHNGFVSVNRVRAALADEDIPARRLSSFWGHFTGPDKPMRRVFHPGTGEPVWEACQGSSSGNNGKAYPARRWVG